MGTTNSHLTPFRFSLQVSQAASRNAWIDAIKRADDAGFDMIVTGDHLEQCLAPLLPLAIAAEVSDRLRLGTMALNNDLYHPLVLARDIATLDLLSEGRMELGLGAGHSKPEYQRAGIAFDDPSIRIDRLAEAVLLLRSLLDGDTVNFEGEHYHLDEARCYPSPIQSHVPLLVGGAGRRIHQIAAKHADAVGFTGLGRVNPDGQTAQPDRFPLSAVGQDIEHLREAAGDRSAHLEIQVLVQAVIITDNDVATAEDICRTRLPSLEPTDILETPYMILGPASAVVEKLLDHRERWGFSHYTVRSEALGQLEPVIAELAGQ